jgi:hypothetical protein
MSHPITTTSRASDCDDKMVRPRSGVTEPMAHSWVCALTQFLGPRAMKSLARTSLCDFRATESIWKAGASYFQGVAAKGAKVIKDATFTESAHSQKHNSPMYVLRTMTPFVHHAYARAMCSMHIAPWVHRIGYYGNLGLGVDMCRQEGDFHRVWLMSNRNDSLWCIVLSVGIPSIGIPSLSPAIVAWQCVMDNIMPRNEKQASSPTVCIQWLLDCLVQGGGECIGYVTVTSVQSALDVIRVWCGRTHIAAGVVGG